jgi:CBS-domain-containing membrane protein
MQITVKDLMAQCPATLCQDATLNEALQMFMDEMVGELYVTDQSGQLVGVVPDYELLKAQLTRLPLSERVETLMSTNVQTTHPGSPVAALAPQFREGRCRKMAVVDNGRIVGEISRHDVLRLMVTLQALDADDEHAQQPTHSSPVMEMRGPQFMRAFRSTAQQAENF